MNDSEPWAQAYIFSEKRTQPAFGRWRLLKISRRSRNHWENVWKEDRRGTAISRLGWVSPLTDLSQKDPTSPLLPPLPLLPHVWVQTPCETLCPVLRLSVQHTSSLPRGIMLMGVPPFLSPTLHSPSPLSGLARLRALLLVLTEHPLIVGISPACLAKLGEGDLRLLWDFGAPLEPDASCFYPHQERACSPQGLPTAMGSHNHPGSVRTCTHAAQRSTSPPHIISRRQNIQST